MNFLNVSSINAAINRNPTAFVDLSERIFDSEIRSAAGHIKLLAADKPIVLVTGPSGSAKTSASVRLADCLTKFGTPAIVISMDNYFLPRDAEVDIPRNPDGSIDFESPFRVDIPYFREQMRKIVNREPVTTPLFDFPSQRRLDGRRLCRPSDGIVIIEGIHALDPVVTGDASDFTFPIYINVATKLIGGGGVSVNPSMIRLMRRLCRDRLFRGRSTREIWDMYNSVALGEDKYITPFRHLAALDIDTFLPFEASVYKDILMRDLSDISSRYAGNRDFSDLVSVLSELDPLPLDVVPPSSIVKEFAGDVGEEGCR
jgi:uridine kinase